MALKTKLCPKCQEHRRLTAFPVIPAYKGGGKSAVCHRCVVTEVRDV